jgi:hypothetical protein
VETDNFLDKGKNIMMEERLTGYGKRTLRNVGKMDVKVSDYYRTLIGHVSALEATGSGGKSKSGDYTKRNQAHPRGYQTFIEFYRLVTMVY